MHICAYCVCVCFRVTVFAFGNFLVVCKKKKKKKKKLLFAIRICNLLLTIINYDIPVTHIRL